MAVAYAWLPARVSGRWLTGLAPGQPLALFPVLVCGFREGEERLEIRRCEGRVHRGQVALQLFDGDGAGENDVDPGVGKGRGQCDRVEARSRTAGELAKSSRGPVALLRQPSG